MLNTDTFFKELLEIEPGLVPLHREHMNANFNEFLPHVFMGDVSRFVEDVAAKAFAGSREMEEKLDRLLAYLESAMISGDEDVDNVISVSFIEHLEYDWPFYNYIKGRLGIELRKTLTVMEQGNHL